MALSMYDRVKSRARAAPPVPGRKVVSRKPFAAPLASMERGMKNIWTDTEDLAMLELAETYCNGRGVPQWKTIYSLPKAHELLKRHIPVDAPNANTKHLFKRLKRMMKENDSSKRDRAAAVLGKCALRIVPATPLATKAPREAPGAPKKPESLFHLADVAVSVVTALFA